MMPGAPMMPGVPMIPGALPPMPLPPAGAPMMPGVPIMPSGAPMMPGMPPMPPAAGAAPIMPGIPLAPAVMVHTGGPGQYPPSQTLYVNNLSEKVKKEDLKKALYLLFSQFGAIQEIYAIKTLKLRGQAWIAFQNLDSAIKACTEMNTFNFYGKAMRVNFAKVKSDVVAKSDGSFQPRPKRKADLRPKPVPKLKRSVIRANKKKAKLERLRRKKALGETGGEDDKDEEEEEEEKDEKKMKKKLERGKHKDKDKDRDRGERGGGDRDRDRDHKEKKKKRKKERDSRSRSRSRDRVKHEDEVKVKAEPRVKPEPRDDYEEERKPKFEHDEDDEGGRSNGGGVSHLPGTTTSPHKRLAVEGLPPQCNTMMLQMLFQQYGGFSGVRMGNDVGLPVGTALIDFDAAHSASQARDNLNGFRITPTHLMTVSFYSQ